MGESVFEVEISFKGEDFAGKASIEWNFNERRVYDISEPMPLDDGAIELLRAIPAKITVMEELRSLQGGSRQQIAEFMLRHELEDDSGGEKFIPSNPTKMRSASLRFYI
jgi:hypothetical protein